MGAVFNVLYAVHPLAPVLFLALMLNGLLAPAIYAWRRHIPLDIGQIRTRASTGESFAKYAYLSWLVFLVPAVSVAGLLIIRLLFR
jgi:hypothetical protein